MTPHIYYDSICADATHSLYIGGGLSYDLSFLIYAWKVIDFRIVWFFSHPDLVSVDWFFPPHYEVQFLAFFASLIIFYCGQDIVHCPSLLVGCGCCPLNSLQCSSDSRVSSGMSLCYFKTVWCVWVLYVRVLEKLTVMCVADLITTSTDTRCICAFSPMSIIWFG